MDFPLPSRSEGTVPPGPAGNATILTVLQALEQCGELQAVYDQGFVEAMSFNPDCNGVSALAACNRHVPRGCTHALDQAGGGDASAALLGVNRTCRVTTAVGQERSSNPTDTPWSPSTIFSACSPSSKNLSGIWSMTFDLIRPGINGAGAKFPETLRLNVTCLYRGLPNGTRIGNRAAVFAALANDGRGALSECFARNAAGLSAAFANFTASDAWKRGWVCQVGPDPNSPTLPYDCWKGVRSESVDNFTIISGRRQATVGFTFLGFSGGRDLLYAIYTGLLAATFAVVSLTIGILLLAVFKTLWSGCAGTFCPTTGHQETDREAGL
jgi:hypothetical protein